MKTSKILTAILIAATITTSTVSATTIYRWPVPQPTTLTAIQKLHAAQLAARNAAARALTLQLQQQNQVTPPVLP